MPPVVLPRTTDILGLRKTLGLDDPNAKPQDAVFVSIDTEFRGEEVLEIGISSLDTRDIMDTAPGRYAKNWISKFKHQHLVIARTANVSPSDTTFRLGGSLFCKSQWVGSSDARTLVLAQLRLARQGASSSAARTVHLVGQSIGGDIGLLQRSTSLRLDLTHGADSLFAFDGVFDTSEIAHAATEHGINFHSRQLGHLARTLHVDPRYWTDSGVRGTHNASNDAAYTLMVLLLLAVRWEELPQIVKMPSRLASQPREVAKAARIAKRSSKVKKPDGVRVPISEQYPTKKLAKQAANEIWKARYQERKNAAHQARLAEKLASLPPRSFVEVASAVVFAWTWRLRRWFRRN